jgi:hypothetical protein
MTDKSNPAISEEEEESPDSPPPKVTAPVPQRVEVIKTSQYSDGTVILIGLIIVLVFYLFYLYCEIRTDWELTS